jgi:hypothetical protein
MVETGVSRGQHASSSGVIGWSHGRHHDPLGRTNLLRIMQIGGTDLPPGVEAVRAAQVAVASGVQIAGPDAKRSNQPTPRPSN